MFELEGCEFVNRCTSVANARAMHLEETLARLELLWLFDRIVFADFYRRSWLGDNGSDLDLWDRHSRDGGS